MQRLLKSALLVCGILNAVSCIAQTNTGNTEQEPVPAVTNQAPVIRNSNLNNSIRLEEKNIQEAPATEDMKLESVPAKKAEKKPAYEEKEVVKDSQAAKMQMMNQFNTNQMNSSRQTSRRSATFQEQSAMDQSVLYFKKTAPNSFERYFYSWLAGHYDVSRASDLMNAAKINPDNPDVLKQKAMYFAVTDQQDSLKDVLATYDTLGNFTEGQLMYAEDLNLSCAEGSILIVHGFDDFLAASYMKPAAANFNIVSLDLMQSESYREMLATWKLTIPVQREVNVAFLQQFCEANRGKQLQLSMTIPADYLQPLKSKLYVEGLTLKYSETPVDTYSHNESLWNVEWNKLLLDNMENDRFYKWSANYKVFLLALREQLYQRGADTYEGEIEHINITLEEIDQKR